MKIELNEMPCFGVAGNFTGHLEQAGEAVDFANVVTKEANAPKAMFPTYIPGNSAEVPEFLHTFPFECGKIIFPANEQKLQIEPECAIICCLEWNGENVVSVKPVAFGASNDCSIRKEGAKKISLKKNWGKASKGLSENLIAIDRFTEGGILDSYRIASFLVRDGNANVYGEDSPVKGYSYIYEKLIEWCLEKFNGQKNEGPAEDIHTYLIECGRPENAMISIGATRYTDYGEHNFLADGDEAVVVVYPDNYSAEEIKKMVERNEFNDDMISVLRQRIIHNS
ncbi:MAG: DUF5718 family protein [Spirochaetia bacterium]|nr:DUF5718 family protein [uncultured Treponema sp.]MCI7397173.1 DUF5718 family protein [Spirochaetia bacterium]